MSEIALWLNQTFYGFDAAIFEFMHNLAQNAGVFFTPFFKFITLLGEKGWFFIVASLVLMLFSKTRKMGICMLIAIIFGALITNVTLKNLINRFRPFVTDAQFKAYWQFMGATEVGESSFPSGHTTSAMAAGMAFFLLGNKKWNWTGLLAAVLMGLSRIYLIVHYTTDVIGGLLVGSIAAVIAYFIVKLIFSLLEKNSGNNKVCRFVLQADILNLLRKKEV